MTKLKFNKLPLCTGKTPKKGDFDGKMAMFGGFSHNVPPKKSRLFVLTSFKHFGKSNLIQVMLFLNSNFFSKKSRMSRCSCSIAILVAKNGDEKLIASKRDYRKRYFQKSSVLLLIRFYFTRESALNYKYFEN